MIVSWNWLKQYVALDMPLEELQQRLMMAGLNHEATSEVAGDLAIDLEVTSNRPDCLGHIGIAREVAVLWNRPLEIPAARPPEGRPSAGELVRVRIDCPELCPRYTARVIRGVKVGPSPRWMTRRLETIGIATINNIVDISNYVLMECGQPLHAFDYTKLHCPEKGTGTSLRSEPVPFSGREIIVRQPLPGETIEAIDHKTYQLEAGMCIIADAEVAVAIGGVMGGAGTEVSEATTDVLIEAAEFDPISIRTTARKLNLHSDSSYRFERRVDPEGLDWASRRCCELILEIAGGELAVGVVDVGQPPPVRPPIVLRLAQLRRVLGIDVDPQRVREILVALGNEEVAKRGEGKPTNLPSPTGRGAGGEGRPRADLTSLQTSPHPNPLPEGEGTGTMSFVPPSWRRDLSREIDLVEEVARIHGYDVIPEDVSVPMAPSARCPEDRVVEKIRHVLTAAGFDEAMTLSVVEEESSGVISPWTDAQPLRSLMPVIRGADRLRTSLVPSLLAARRTNEALSNPEIELFETAKVYLPRVGQAFQPDVDRPGVRPESLTYLPDEQGMLAITSGRDYAAVRGVIEAIVATLNPAVQLDADLPEIDLLDPAASCSLRLGGEMLGYVGRLRPEGLKRFDLRGPTTVAEVKLGLLAKIADLVPRYVPLPPYPAVTRDINLVVGETVRWADVAATVRQYGGPYFEGLDYRDTYRDPERLGPGKKSLLFTIALRWKEGTLTSQQADEVRDQVVAACGKQHGAELRA
jgi:phenylalanyl-tRNA synthetase beta chain